MKKRKKLIKRIGAVLCAFVVVFGSVGGSVSYKADIYSDNTLDYASLLYNMRFDFPVANVSYTLPSEASEYDYYVVLKLPSNNKLYLFMQNQPFELELTSKGYSGFRDVSLKVPFSASEKFFISSDGVNWSTATGGGRLLFTYSDFDDDSSDKFVHISSYVDSNHALKIQNTDYIIFENGGIYDVALYNPTFGYLQNVKHNVVFDDVPLGENVAETFTERWYYDSLSTTGVDLTSGDYVIRYYQEKWIVTGYGEDDVVKKSDRYVLGDYIVQNGYIETYSESVESTLAGQGYEEPSIFDLLWNKFVTTHYYFQIVNAKTNEVGGLLHVYLTDDNGKFGVEHIGETLDNEGNYDEGGYKDFIDEDKVTTDDVEQGFDDLENGSNVDFGSVDGVDEFGVTLESFASQVSNVTGGVHALLSSMPPWVLGLLGVSFVLLVVGIIFKIV